MLQLRFKLYSRDNSRKKAKMAITKRSQFTSRPRMFLRLAVVKALTKLALQQGDKASAMLYLAAYVFLLRVPSEGLPIAKYGSGVGRGENSVSWVKDKQLYLRLLKRKNKLNGSHLTRSCCVLNAQRHALCMCWANMSMDCLMEPSLLRHFLQGLLIVC